jgi:hypothetical protein
MNSFKFDEQAQQEFCLPVMFNVSTQTQPSKYFVALLLGDQSVLYSTLLHEHSKTLKLP